MSNCRVFVGLDYHQNAVQVCVMDGKGVMLANRTCANDWRAIVAFVLRHGRAVEVALESCSGAADLADELAIQADWSVQLAHPGYVSRMKQSPDKSDYTDARMLADLVRVGYLPRVWLAPQETRELRRLVRYRQQLVNERRNVKLRIRALLREQRCRCQRYTAWTAPWLDWVEHTEALSEQGRWIIAQYLTRIQQLSADIFEVGRRLAQVTADDPMVELLCSLPGIGLVTAWTLRAEIGRFDRFRTGKQLSRFCGLSPRNASSGERQADAGLIKAGNPSLRATVIEAAHRLIRWEPRWRALGERMRARGKPGSVVAAAVGNRWLRWLYHQLQPTPVAA